MTGRNRWLSATSYSTLMNKLGNRQNTISGSVAITTDNVGKIQHCSMFSVNETGGRCTLVAATPDYISVLVYSTSQRIFNVMQVLCELNYSLFLICCLYCIFICMECLFVHSNINNGLKKFTEAF